MILKLADKPNSYPDHGRPFIKMHGLRNDIVIVDGRLDPFSPTSEEIVLICDRREGVGGDELMIISSPKNENTEAFIKIFNTDGREVEACGNGTRCIGRFLLDESEKEEIKVETLGGVLIFRKNNRNQISVNMGQLKTEWKDIPISREMDTLHLGIANGPLKDPVGMNIGNPHAVFFVEDVDAIDLSEYALTVQKNDLFPEETNVGIAQILDSNNIKLSYWERPGNMTPACGTGACATVGAAFRRGLIKERRITVNMPAGKVEIELQEDFSVIMTGPAEYCFSGYLPNFIPQEKHHF